MSRRRKKIQALKDAKRVLQEQIRDMHDLVERLQAGAAVDRYHARLEIAIEPTYLPDGRSYFIAPEGFQKAHPWWYRNMFLQVKYPWEDAVRDWEAEREKNAELAKQIPREFYEAFMEKYASPLPDEEEE